MASDIVHEIKMRNAAEHGLTPAYDRHLLCRAADEIKRLQAEIDRLRRERDEMAEWMIEIEVICRDEAGRLYWISCGDFVGGES